MRRSAGLLGILAIWAGGAGPAAAQGGAGLYEPFPEPAGAEISRDFIGALPSPGPALAAELAAAELERGVRVGVDDLPAGFALPPAAAGETGERAQPGSGESSALGWLGATAVVALVCAGAARLARW